MCTNSFFRSIWLLNISRPQWYTKPPLSLWEYSVFLIASKYFIDAFVLQALGAYSLLFNEIFSSSYKDVQAEEPSLITISVLALNNTLEQIGLTLKIKRNLLHSSRSLLYCSNNEKLSDTLSFGNKRVFVESATLIAFSTSFENSLLLRSKNNFCSILISFLLFYNYQ